VVTPPSQLGRYQIEEEIGRGMMGVVYRARDPDLGRLVALKTVQLAFTIAEDQKASFERRFLAEARAAAALSHPNIVVVHDVGRDPASGTPYIALEYLAGQPLSERLESGRLPMREALRIGARLADALHHAHAHGIVHRDVKPANIMIVSGAGDEPGVKLMDFGVAKVPASQLTAAGEFFGTPSYMSPEQALGHPVDGRSDLFSLGGVLYAMLTGERAFDGPSVPTILAMIAHRDVPAPSQRVPELPADVDAVVARALAKDPGKRYPDGRTLAEDLEDVRQGRPPRHRPAPFVAASGERTVASAAPRAPTPGARVPSPATQMPPAATRTPPRWSPSRRRLLGLGAAAAVLAVGLTLTSLSTGMRSKVLSTALPVPPPAQLELTLEHPLKTGTVRVFVDDELTLEEVLEGRVVQKFLSVELRKGSLAKTLYLAPGERVIRVLVEGETFTTSRRITGTFVSGEARRLHADVETLLKKEVRLHWRQ
jgi:eukaryotic-like serine/threonine-protein kinase